MSGTRRAFILSPKQSEPLDRNITHHIDAIGESSRRTRWHSVVLALAFILTFVATWNVLPTSWLRGRVELARAERSFYVATHDERLAMIAPANPYQEQWDRAYKHLRERGMMDSQLTALPRRHETTFMLGSLPVASPPPATTAQATSVPVQLPQPGHLDVDYNLVDLDRAVERLESAELADLKLIHVSALGVVLDVNDLGLVAGLAFAIILLMRAMSLANEYFAIRTAMQRALSCRCLRDAYDLLAVSQVFTVPLRDFEYHDRHGVGAKVWSYRLLPILLNALPAFITLVIFITNILTLDKGMFVSPSSTLVSLALNFITFAAVVVLVGRNVTGEFRVMTMFDALALGDETRVREALSLEPLSALLPSKALSPEERLGLVDTRPPSDWRGVDRRQADRRLGDRRRMDRRSTRPS